MLYDSQHIEHLLQNPDDFDDFKNLKELCIKKCENWEDVVLLNSETMKLVPNLESLSISRCRLKRVFEYSRNRGDDVAILPKVYDIILKHLDQLENVFANTVTPAVMPKGSFQRLEYLY